MKKIILFITLLLFGVTIFSQTIADIRINEFSANYNGDLINPLGNKSPWIELYNTSLVSLNVGTMYLTDDRNDLKKYQLPKSDELKISANGFLIIYLDTSKHFHPTVASLSTETGYLALVLSDGRTIVDSVVYDPKLITDGTFLSRTIDGAGNWEITDISTPLLSNDIKIYESPNEIVKRLDPYGIGISIICFFIVIIILIMLYLAFYYIWKIKRPVVKTKRVEIKKEGEDFKTEIIHNEEEISSEVLATIGTALHLYLLSMHDYENGIITIKKVTKPYSPWSSKLYNLTPTPQKINLPKKIIYEKNRPNN
ncbi:MAG TPA: lamin tail domain-containing protein [Bacteroidales bacterium]|nr:lamin tail domain-containing protein [Bacteroidales bacterium]